MVEFTNKNSQDIVNRCIASLRNTTNITQLAPGSKARYLLEIFSRELANTYSSFNTDLLNVFVQNASGNNLDLIGELLGVTRQPLTRNELLSGDAIQRFYVDNGGNFGSINNGNNITLPRGTIVSTRIRNSEEQPIEYLIPEAVTLPAASTEYFVPIKAVEFGSTSNLGAKTLTVHNFENYTDWDSDTPLLRTENIESITYAANEETDAQFRYRILNSTLASEAANETALRLRILSIPGVADMVFDEFTSGIGTGTIYVKGIVPVISDALIATIQNEVNRIKAFGNYIEVKSPDTVGLAMDIEVTVNSTLKDSQQITLIEDIKNLTYNYVNSLDIGATFEAQTLVNQILRSNINIIKVGSNDKLLNHLYLYRDSGTLTQRISEEVQDRYVPAGYERIIIETETDLSSNGGAVRVVVKLNG